MDFIDKTLNEGKDKGKIFLREKEREETILYMIKKILFCTNNNNNDSNKGQ